MNNAVFWNVTSCGPCKDRRFGGMYRLRNLDDKNQQASNSVGGRSVGIVRSRTKGHGPIALAITAMSRTLRASAASY
jgi:hypothetical protein